jgi:NADH-quinone oxidoreductase subunit E
MTADGEGVVSTSSTTRDGSTNEAGQFDETTVAELRQIIARYPQSRSALIPMLHLLQSVEGRVTARGIEICADLLGISAAEVSGVATFYTMYKRRPVGAYHVGVCTNTLCAVMGGDAIFERLKDHLDIGNDETTDDGMVTLEHVECNAACDYAPVVMVNWEFMDNQTPESATRLVDDLRQGKEVRSTRGPRVCSWREAERVLAGFPDDRADDGPAAGPATLLGLRIAREQGWSAPPTEHEAGRESGSEGRTGDAGGPAGRSGLDAQTAMGRAPSEGAVAESDAETAGEDAGGRQNPKGGS